MKDINQIKQTFSLNNFVINKNRFNKNSNYEIKVLSLHIS